jgi:site-specific recombinase XerD
MTTALARQDLAAEIVQMVLDSVNSDHTRRAYKRAISDFLAWYSSSGRSRLDKAAVQRYAAELREQGMGAASINQRLSAIRKLAREAADNGALPAELAKSVESVRGVKQAGKRLGNWLSAEQASRLIQAPDVTTLRGLRDRAILAVLLGCGLRRQEAAGLCIEHLQVREGRWVIVDLVGKGNKARSVPVPGWVKVCLDDWTNAAGLREGYVFRSVGKSGHVGVGITAQTVRNVVVETAAMAGLGEIAPHDLRRTFAQLARKGGADLEQIQLSLGHASVSTTERYLGTRQDLVNAPGDRLGIVV